MDWNSIVSGCYQDSGDIHHVVSLTCVPAVMRNVVTAALVFGAAISVIFMILAGIRYISSDADKKKAEDAHKTLTYAIMGLILLFLSFGIVQSIASILGIPCLILFGFGSCQ